MKKEKINKIDTLIISIIKNMKTVYLLAVKQKLIIFLAYLSFD